MKRFFIILLMFIYFSINSCLAFSEVYYVKNTTCDNLKATVMNGFYSQDFNIEKQDPYYGKSVNNPDKYAVVILQQSGNNLFYYYNSNGNKKINKYILKSINRSGLEYEQSFNTNILDVYDNLADRIINSQVTNSYVFTDNDSVSSTKTVSATVQNYNSKALQGYVVKIPDGTKLNVYLQNAINTANASVGDKITAVVTKDYKYNGISIIPQGSIVYGELTKARHASYGSRNGKVVINFDHIVTPDGKTYDITTEKVDFTVSNDGKVSSVATGVLTGAIIGGLAGLLIGALSGNIGKVTAISAGIGAGTAAIANTAEMGVDAEIPSFTEMEITLTKSFTTTVSY